MTSPSLNYNMLTRQALAEVDQLGTLSVEQKDAIARAVDRRIRKEIAHPTFHFTEHPRAVWCYCYRSAEPSGPWVFPDSTHAEDHADMHGYDVRTTS